MSEDEWGMQFGEHLRNSVTFSRVEDELTLFNKDNQPIIIFKRK